MVLPIASCRRLLIIACGIATLLLGSYAPFVGAEEPKAPEKADDPLPPGAIVRFGTTRPILADSPGVALLAPKYVNFLAPTVSGGARRYDVGTGRPVDKRGLVGAGQVVASADGKQ